VVTVEFRRENRRRALFDIVILGRGTRAAAWLAIASKVKLWRYTIEQRRLNARVLLQDKIVQMFG
jgi:hypothetical protein